MVLLEKWNNPGQEDQQIFAFDKVIADGYTIQEDIPVVTGEVTTASGFIKRSYAPYRTTNITVTLDNLNEEDLSAYLNQLDEPQAVFRFWSPKKRTYRIAPFLIECSEIAMVSAVGEKTFNSYTLTLTQNGPETLSETEEG